MKKKYRGKEREEMTSKMLKKIYAKDGKDSSLRANKQPAS